APMFSNLSGSSISLATVTPSLVTLGEPHDFSSTTLRPRGPRVTVTASARTLTPRSTLARASSLNFTIFAGMSLSSYASSGLDDAEDVFLTQDEVLLAVDLDFRSRVLAEQDAVARLHIEGNDLAILVYLPFAHGDDLALLGLLLRGVRDDDAAGTLLLLLLEPLDDQPVGQRSNPGCHDWDLPPGSTVRLPGHQNNGLWIGGAARDGSSRRSRAAQIRSFGLAVKGRRTAFFRRPAGWVNRCQLRGRPRSIARGERLPRWGPRPDRGRPASRRSRRSTPRHAAAPGRPARGGRRRSGTPRRPAARPGGSSGRRGRHPRRARWYGGASRSRRPSGRGWPGEARPAVRARGAFGGGPSRSGARRGGRTRARVAPRTPAGR